MIDEVRFEHDEADIYDLVVTDEETGETTRFKCRTDCALSLHDQVVRVMGPYVFEMESARREYLRGDRELSEEGLEPHQRQSFLEHADIVRDMERGK